MFFQIPQLMSFLFFCKFQCFTENQIKKYFFLLIDQKELIILELFIRLFYFTKAFRYVLCRRGGAQTNLFIQISRVQQSMFGDGQYEGNIVALFPSERCLSNAVLAVQHTNTDQHN